MEPRGESTSKPVDTVFGHYALRGENEAAAVRLLARTQAGDPAGRACAPNARLDEWAQHLGQIFATPIVGSWIPEASLVARGSGPRWARRAHRLD